MRKRLLIAWCLICALAISGCAASGASVKPGACPTLSPAPPNLMQEPHYEQSVRAELFAPQPNATHKSGGSRPSSNPIDP